MKSYVFWRTRHNVRIDAPLASIGNRIGAYIMDSLIKGLYVILILNLYGLIFDSAILGVIIPLVAPVLFYTFLFESFNDGQTPGKAICKIKTTHVSGKPAGLEGAFLRWIFRIIDFSVLTPIVALVSAASSKKRQRIGGLVSDTVVVETTMRRRSIYETYTQLKPTYEPIYMQAKRLTRDEVALIRKVLKRDIGANREEMINKLVKSLKEKHNIESSDPPKRFLFSLVKDYNYFLLHEK